MITLRRATENDVPFLPELITASARGLGSKDYTKEQIEAALETAWGLDTELIQDRTYFVAEDASAGSAQRIVACGGWSRRATLFGGDMQLGRQSHFLNPQSDAARIRAFFVHPDYARQGLGRALLVLCEEEACAYGFRSAELMATLPGQRLYQSLGYVDENRIVHPLAGGLTINFVAMKKDLVTSKDLALSAVSRRRVATGGLRYEVDF